MLSRKEFFNDLLFRGIRAVNDLCVGRKHGSTERSDPVSEFDLPATELSPSLLVIEAERRGIELKTGHSEELRRKIYQELAHKGPGLDTGRP